MLVVKVMNYQEISAVGVLISGGYQLNRLSRYSDSKGMQEETRQENFISIFT